MDTGDLAYLVQGCIYLTGRRKDVIIRAGRNHYPQGIEAAVGEVAGVRKGCVAAFGSPDPRTGTERIVILAETRVTDSNARERLHCEIAGAAARVLCTATQLPSWRRPAGTRRWSCWASPRTT